MDISLSHDCLRHSRKAQSSNLGVALNTQFTLGNGSVFYQFSFVVLLQGLRRLRMEGNLWIIAQNSEHFLN